MNRLPPVILNLVFLNLLVYLTQAYLEGRVKEGQIPVAAYSQVFHLHKLNPVGVRGEATDPQNGTTYYTCERMGQRSPCRPCPSDFQNCTAGVLPTGPGFVHIWQPLLYFFSHGGFFHFAINMLFLVLVGGGVEAVLGSRRFLALYLFSGLMGGALTMLFDPSSIPVTGSSVAVYGVILGFGGLFPNHKLYFILLPFGFKAYKLILFLATYSALMIFVSDPDVGGTSHFGHLAGMGGGALYFVLEPLFRRWL